MAEKGTNQILKTMQSPTEEEMLMVTSIEELNITGLISRKQPESEDINLKEVDNYMDMFLMESTEAKIQEVLPSEDTEEMTYEGDRFWNMEEITEWDDEFKIEMKSNDYELHREQEDELEQEAMMLTNIECEDLKKFLVQEAGEKPRVFCKSCTKRTCEDCENLQNRYKEEDRKIYKEVWDLQH